MLFLSRKKCNKDFTSYPITQECLEENIPNLVSARRSDKSREAERRNQTQRADLKVAGGKLDEAESVIRHSRE